MASKHTCERCRKKFRPSKDDAFCDPCVNVMDDPMYYARMADAQIRAVTSHINRYDEPECVRELKFRSFMNLFHPSYTQQQINDLLK